MEKFLLRKLEMWVLLLVLLVVAVLFALFGTVIIARQKHDDAGGLFGDVAMAVAKFPKTVKRVFKGDTDDHRVKGRNFPESAGFHYEGPVANPGYILVNRYDGDIRSSVSELYREGEAKPIHRWTYDNVADLQFPITNPLMQEPITGDPASRRMMAALPTDDGGLIFHFEDGKPLYKMDACGKVVWKDQDFVFHHSLERDADGNIWGTAHSLNPAREHGFDGRFRDDYIVKVSPQGRTLFSKSILQLLTENDLINRSYTYDNYETDPFHLNDAQPVPGDGPYWKKGDVFISLGHMNMLLLYRPSTNTLLWWTQDKVMHQHDIDVVDDHTIMVFDNNRIARAKKNLVIGQNEELFYDFATRKFTSPYKPAFVSHDVRTVSEGLANLIPGGDLFVEESNEGRIFRFAPDGTVRWQYINKNSKGELFSLNWSRYLSASAIAPALAAFGNHSCNKAEVSAQ